MGRKKDAQLVKIEEELADIRRYQADIANRIETVQRYYKKDMITIRDLLTQMIEGN